MPLYTNVFRFIYMSNVSICECFLVLNMSIVCIRNTARSKSIPLMCTHVDPYKFSTVHPPSIYYNLLQRREKKRNDGFSLGHGIWAHKWTLNITKEMKTHSYVALMIRYMCVAYLNLGHIIICTFWQAMVWADGHPCSHHSKFQNVWSSMASCWANGLEMS
jgi:hypothetical protein